MEDGNILWRSLRLFLLRSSMEYVECEHEVFFFYEHSNNPDIALYHTPYSMLLRYHHHNKIHMVGMSKIRCRTLSCSASSFSRISGGREATPSSGR